jgi:hypothetical protein
MTSSVAFTVDDTADHTESGTSRYGAYLTHHQHLFRDGDIPTTDLAEFAIAAWRVALPPIMTPSYLRPHPRVQGSDAHWDEEHRAALVAHLASTR